MSTVGFDAVARGAAPAQRRLALALWSAGMLGVTAVTLLMLPAMLARLAVPLPMPFWLLATLSLLQSAAMLAVAVWAGLACAARIGLHAPGFEAWAARGDVAAALRPAWLPGIAAGVLGGAALYGVGFLAPAALTAVGNELAPPLAVRLLYGGVTEELLMRWGLMSWLAWLAWRGLHRGEGKPGAAAMWCAILVTAVLFGVGHLPAAFSLLGGLDVDTVVFVVGANALFGTLFGWLYWRRGLEAAMLAHGIAHLVAFALTPSAA